MERSKYDSYGDFIREAFIDPIRTVIVVDDEFPSLDGLIRKQISEANANAACASAEHTAVGGQTVLTRDEKGSENDRQPLEKVPLRNQDDLRNAQRALEIIDFCRTGKWIVEINDGQFEPDSGMDQAISNLHQSDLLILDYHLDRDNPSDGTRAIEIIRHLARNDHFNLVLVYTKGYEDSAGDIERVVLEIAIGLRSVRVELDQNLEDARELIEGLEDSESEVLKQFRETIDDGIFLKCADSVIAEGGKALSELPELEQFRRIDSATIADGEKRLQLLKQLLHDKQQEFKGKKLFSEDCLGKIEYDSDGNGVNWIRTDRVFITVVSKTQQPKELPQKLIAALKKWNPAPHRLLMSKMRAALDQDGVEAEAKALENHLLQAGWLDEFLADNELERPWKIRSTVARHWESLWDGIQVQVNDFSENLVHFLLKDGKTSAIEQYAPSLLENDEAQQIKLHMNRYVCSKPVEGHYLMTGHVLEIPVDAKKEAETRLWICLSPACDLVPRVRKGWPERLARYMPFKAVELIREAKLDTALKKAVDGNYLFFDIGEDHQCFCFTENSKSAPKWEQMFASNQGQFDPSQKITVQRVLADDNGKLAIREVEARIVAQLRYEYALNLLHRLGANLSRVGLDFVRYP